MRIRHAEEAAVPRAEEENDALVRAELIARPARLGVARENGDDFARADVLVARRAPRAVEARHRGEDPKLALDREPRHAADRHTRVAARKRAERTLHVRDARCHRDALRHRARVKDSRAAR